VKTADISGTKKKKYLEAKIDEFETNRKIKKYQRLVWGHQ
jgi:hypothetical protein